MSANVKTPPDDRTVLVTHEGDRPACEPLTDFSHPPRVESIDARLVYASTPRPLNPGGISINPVVAAAAPLLCALIKLQAKKATSVNPALKTELTDHLKSFETQMNANGMDPHETSMARYMLCTVADEVVTSSCDDSQKWSAMGLLSSFHNETSGGVRFFELLDDMSRFPAKYLATLELVYICLSLGFTGKYHVGGGGVAELEKLRDGLYRQIRHMRGDVPRDFSPHWTGLSGKRRRVVRVVPGWFVAAFTVFCLLTTYSGFAYVLGHKREAVVQRYLPAEVTAQATQDSAASMTKGAQ